MKLSERMEQDADSWDEKNEGVEVPKECSGDYIYGYNAGCAETFRACAYRTVALESSLAAKDAEIARLREKCNQLADHWSCTQGWVTPHHIQCAIQLRAALAETPAAPEVK